MSDPLSDIVELLQPKVTFTKSVLGHGHWKIRNEGNTTPLYSYVIQGNYQVTLDNHNTFKVNEGDFILIPEGVGFSATTGNAPEDIEDYATPVNIGQDIYRIGNTLHKQDTHLMVGHYELGSPDSAVLLDLPQVIVVHASDRLESLVKMISVEFNHDYPAREVLLQKMFEILLIEAFRSLYISNQHNCIVRGLADERLAPVLKAIHSRAEYTWTMQELANIAALSRTSFFNRFSKIIGKPPMDYLLTWRMALAKRHIRESKCSLAEVAEKAGYSSVSAFSVAFNRHTGLTPSAYGRMMKPKN